MKINEIISENTDLEEAPVGMMKRAGQAIAGKFSKTQARKGEISKEANEVFKELKIQFGGSEYDLNRLPAEKLISFMQKKGYGDGIKQQVEKFTDANDPESVLNKKQIEQIVLTQTREAAADSQPTSKGRFAKKGSAGDKSSSSAKGASADLKKVAQAVRQLSDQEKQQLAKLIQ